MASMRYACGSAMGLVLGMAAATITTSAHAQTSDAQQATSQGGLEDIVVTARKREESAQSVPNTIAAISPLRLEQTATRTLADLSAITPGLQIQSSVSVNPASTFIHLRGFSQPDDLIGFDQPVTVYVDNVFAEGVGGTAGTNFYDVERVEILKGPQGTLFGRNSVGGALQVFTKTPTDQFEGQVLAGVSNRDGRRLAGFINTPLSENASFRLTSEYDKVGGWMRSATTGERQGGRETFLVRGALLLDPSPDLNVIVRAAYSRIEAFGTPVRLAYLPTTGPAYLSILAEQGANPFAPTAADIAKADAAIAANINAPKYTNFTSSNRPQVVDQFRASAEVSYELSDSVTLRSITGYRHLKSRSQTDVDGTQFSLLTAPQRRKLDEFSQELQLSFQGMDDRLNLIVGGYYYYFNGEEVQQGKALVGLLSLIQPGAKSSTTEPHLKRTSPAVFGQASFALTPTVNVTGGIRYTSDKQTQNAFGTTFADYELTIPVSCNIPIDTTLPCQVTFKNKDTAVTWLGSVDWNPVAGTMFYAKAARGFHSGGYTPRQTTAPLGAVPFKPEYITEFEIGSKSDLFDRVVRLNTAFYYDKFSDVQITVPVFTSTGFGLSIQNAGKVNLWGADIELQVAPTEGVTFGATLGYTDYEFKSVQIFNSVTGTTVNAADAYRLDNLPKWQYSLFASYEVPTSFGSITPSLSWRWQSEQVINPTKVRGPETFPAELTGIPGFSVGSPDRFQLQGSYGLLSGQLKVHLEAANMNLSVFGRNILNEYYSIQQSDLVRAGLGLIPSVIGESRTFGIELSKSF